MHHVTQRLAAAIPTGSFRQIEGAGHAAAFDAPVAFSDVIADSISAITSGGT